MNRIGAGAGNPKLAGSCCGCAREQVLQAQATLGQGVKCDCLMVDSLHYCGRIQIAKH